MKFAFGCAKPLYARRVHPRVLASPNDLVALRRQVRTGLRGKLMRALREKVAPLTARVLSSKNLTAMISQWNHGWDQPGTAVIQNLHDIAMVGVLDRNPGAVDAVRRVLNALPEADEIAGRGSKTIGYGMEPPTLLAYDLTHDALDESERERFARWVVDFWVRRTLGQWGGQFFRCAGANIPMLQLLTGLTGLLVVEGDPGVPDLGAERQRMLLMLEASLHSAIGPNGYPAEDIGYGTSMVSCAAYVVEAVRRAGLYDAYARCPRFVKFGRAMLHFVQPWGRALSNTGDHGDDFRARGFVLARLAAETRDPALLWLLRSLHYPSTQPPKYPNEVPMGRGLQLPANACTLMAFDDREKPRHPSKTKMPTQFMDPARGIVTFRSGWRADDTLVVFDGSQRPTSAQGHAHDSAGHFSLSALGEYFAIDTGRYNIEQNCHNVVLVDGQSGRSTDGEWRASNYHGNLIEYAPGDFCDFAAVDSSHQHNCHWARRYLGLVKGNGAPGYVWTVEDINKANDWAEFWWQLHTSPENVIELRSLRRESGDDSPDSSRDHRLTSVATITGWRHGNLLDVHFVLPAPGRFPKPHALSLRQDVAVPSSHKYVTDPRKWARGFARPADMVHHGVMRRPRLLAKVAGYNGRFISILIPRRKGEKSARVTRLPSLDNSLAVKIAFRDVEDTLIFGYEHNLLEADGIRARGQWVIARRACRTGNLVDWTLGCGTRLVVDGQRVRA